jgi:hypothetical protein
MSSFYQFSVPVFLRGLNVLAELLRKGEAHAQAQGTNPAELLEARLAPDMFNLVRQVQSVSDAAKAGGARLAAVEVPSMADTETTFAELQERIAKTVRFLETLKPADLDGHEGREVAVKLRSGELRFTAQHYLLTFALPNFFFHITTAYDILRHKGVAVGKMDYLGNFDFARQGATA